MSPRHKALLIGASDYDEPGIRSLPFVRDDLVRLSAALTERGFHATEVAESKRGITLNFVKEQVSRFLREAKRDDTLWILLSGHGQHYEGTDPAGRGGRSRMRSSMLVRMLPEPVLRWRLMALYATGAGDTLGAHVPSVPREVAAAMPSDLILLSSGSENNLDYWTTCAEPGWPHIEAGSISLQKAGWSSLSNLFRWRTPSAEVTPADVFACVAVTKRPAAYVVERLAQLGYSPPSMSNAVNATHEDTGLLRPLGDHNGWLTPGAALSVPQISYSAARAGCSPANAATRLRELGYDVPDYAYRGTPWTREDARLLARLWAWSRKHVPIAQAHEISTARIITVAFNQNRSVRAIVQLLMDAGFTPSAEATRLDVSSVDDSVLLSDQLPIDRLVPRGQLAALAQRLNRTVPEIAERLTTLGFQVPHPLPARDLVTTEDSAIFKGRHFAAGWPAEDQSLDLFTLAGLTYFSSTPLSAIAARLSGLGYTIAPDPTMLEALAPADAEVLQRTNVIAVPPDHLYAVTQLTGLTTEEATDGLTRLGIHVEPFPEDFAADIAMEKQLDAALNSETPALVESPTRRPARRISLPALASLAIRRQTTFREVALLATRLGMTHEAEDWFR